MEASAPANLTTADIATRLNVDAETVRRMCRSGKWQATRIGKLYRFTEDQYQNIITPPPAPQGPRTQRKNIEQLFRNL